MHILYAVMAIALTVLVTFGGINYINADGPVRVVQTNGLMGQYEALVSAVTTYRNSNNGVEPADMRSFKGLLPKGGIPRFGAAAESYVWLVSRDGTDGKPAMCLRVTGGERIALQSARQYAAEMARRHPHVTVVEGHTLNCKVADGDAEAEADDETATGNDVYFTLKGY